MGCVSMLSSARTDQKQDIVTHLSLNALRIRSTSFSRWNADASRESSCSISVSVVGAGVFELEGVDVPVDIGRRRCLCRRRSHSGF
jgi:hypothetical protein